LETQTPSFLGSFPARASTYGGKGNGDADEGGYILETFPIVKRHDEQKFLGKYRTKDLILQYMNAYAAGDVDAWVKG
jgi:hypothetical protein